jgi:hypothetical protein
MKASNMLHARSGRLAVRAGVCIVGLSVAAVLGAGVALADVSDDYFIATARQNSQLSGLDDQQLITLGNSVCGVLYGTMTANPFATYPGSTLSSHDAETVASAAVEYYCPSVVQGNTDASPNAGDYHPDDGSPGTDSWVMKEMAGVNERNLGTAGGW